MAKEYSQRPSSLLNGRLGDWALDLDVYRIGASLDGGTDEDRKKKLIKLERDAAAEQRYEERHGA